jgi:tetratricopeptide (TPR) repeat protein
MAVAEPYAPCPCGSGQKFKWCCQKVEAVAQRAQRLFESGQVQGAFEALDEGLRKEPDSPLLLIRKAAYRIHRKDIEGAQEPLRRLVRKAPGHLAAQSLLPRLVLETEGPQAGAAQFQQALSSVDRERRPALAEVARVVAAFLAESGFYPAALKHLELEEQLAPDGGRQSESPRRAIEGNAGIAAWLKNSYRLAEPPQGLPTEAWQRFAEALGWAREGLWNAAAAAFELLSSGGKLPEADRNLGLCRLWTGDHAAALPALRRWVARAGATPEAVDIEALCQQITPAGPDDTIEQVQLIWPLRDRERLLEILREDPKVHPEGRGPIDPAQADSPEVEQFGLLDRPPIAAGRGLSPSAIPRYMGRVLVGQEIAALESFDDGRLNALSERFTTLAGSTIVPAHPRTKVLGKVVRANVALTWEWFLPEGLERDEVDRLNREQGAAIIRDVWPRTPIPSLGGRTAAAVAAGGNGAVPLRAAVFSLELSPESWRDEVDFPALRASLGIGPEPEIDPETVDLAQLHLARLNLVPVDRLSDQRLVALYDRARRTMQLDALERSARRLIERPSVAVLAKLESFVLYTDMVSLMAARGRTAEALQWLDRGRQADPVAARAGNAPIWDMLEIRLRSQIEPPSSWVPALAAVLERHGQDRVAHEKVVVSLVEMGLLRLVARPDKPEEVLLDVGPLQALMATYGPRVTTATGELGMAASRSAIWTPGSAAGGGGGIWTPGSGAAPPTPGGDKPKLIIPGR